MIDLSNLSASPWEALPLNSEQWIVQYPDGEDVSLLDETHAAFIAIARNAFDIMMRRGWYPYPFLDGYWGIDARPASIPEELATQQWPDPYTAIVEADKWFRENVENKEQTR